jgi:hypothetical protein
MAWIPPYPEHLEVRARCEALVIARDEVFGRQLDVKAHERKLEMAREAYAAAQRAAITAIRAARYLPEPGQVLDAGVDGYVFLVALGAGMVDGAVTPLKIVGAGTVWSEGSERPAGGDHVRDNLNALRDHMLFPVRAERS